MENFDNVALRIRRNGCAVTTVSPPFRTAHWPSLEALAKELGLIDVSVDTIDRPEAQVKLLTALAERVPGCEAFQPARVGWRLSRQEIRGREAYRQNHRMVTFLGRCSREVMLEGLEAATHGLSPKASVEVQFKESDILADWSLRADQVREAYSLLFQAKQLRVKVLVFSELRGVDESLVEFVYEHPPTRIAWLATALAECASAAELGREFETDASFANLGRLSNAGIWPHVVLPISRANVRILNEIVLTVLEVTRGASIELLPTPCIRQLAHVPAPPEPDDYASALVGLYNDTGTPPHLVSPMSWVAARMNSEVPLISSAEAVGAHLVILPDGSAYPSEWALGFERHCLGNVLASQEPMRWERLDALPETVDRSVRSEGCSRCDWRYRCGGLDPQSFPRPEDQQSPAPGSVVRKLYCQPRKRLFEEMFWARIDAAKANGGQAGRERLTLLDQGVAFQPVDPANVVSAA